MVHSLISEAKMKKETNMTDNKVKASTENKLVFFK